MIENSLYLPITYIQQRDAYLLTNRPNFRYI